MQTEPEHRRRDVLRKIDALPLLPEKKQALREAVLDLLQDRRALGVALWGSVVRGEPDPGDFDAIVLHAGKESWTRRRLYRGCSVHIQMRSLARFREMNVTRKQTRSDREPTYAEVLCLWDQTDTFAKARAKGRRCRARGPKPVSRWEAGRLQAELACLTEEMEALQGDRAAFALHAAHTLTRCGVIHLRLRGQWVVGEKQVLKALGARDAEMAARYRKAAALLTNPAACLKATRGLAAEALAPVGGVVGEFEVWYR